MSGNKQDKQKRLCAFRTQPFVLFSNHLFLPASLFAVGAGHFARAPHVRRKESAFEGWNIAVTAFRTFIISGKLFDSEKIESRNQIHTEGISSVPQGTGIIAKCRVFRLRRISLRRAGVSQADTLPAPMQKMTGIRTQMRAVFCRIFLRIGRALFYFPSGKMERLRFVKWSAPKKGHRRSRRCPFFWSR